MGSPRLLVVEDDPFTLTTLSSAIEAGGMEIAGLARNAAQALAIFDSLGADIAVLDLDLGSGPTGLDLAHALRGRDPKIGIIILTSYDDPRLLRPDLPSIPKGGAYLRKQSDEVRSHELTNSQCEVLRGVARGLSNSQIASELGVTDSAVEKSIGRIAKQLSLYATDGNLRVQLTQSYLRMVGKDIGLE
jgi:DNA-binding NarL/FixJ family response regulator